uniref:VWFD domain-containing protein n=1 Tax=Bracon brevicornis TaxID=1563983 RepID=A0A6V7IJM7_9HYME
MSDKYRDSVRGLCSNYDGEKNNDFLTPRNRLAPNPEDFSALYTLPVAECKSVAQNLRMMEKSLPRDSPRFQNVVSDRDAGRSTHPKNNWGPQSSPKSLKNQKNTIVRTKVIPYNDQTCFTLRPLPTCVPGTEPQSVRTVLFPVFCLPNGDSANRLADRINRGANPDLSQKSPSMKVKLDIPERCSPAA